MKKRFLLLALALSVGTAHADNAEYTNSITLKTAQLLDNVLTEIATRKGDTDTQWYEKGVWHFKNEEKSWPVQGGPGTAAAVLWKWKTQIPALGNIPLPPLSQSEEARRVWLRQVAAETFNRALDDHLHPDGYFDEDKTPATYFFATELATTYYLLQNSLDDPTRTKWRRALVQMVDYLIKTNNLPTEGAPGWKATDGWYTNGNIELGEAELVFLMWKITGEQKYKDLYELQLKHTLTPGERWKEFGLRITKEPTKEDGSDGAGYLAESGAKGTGYDGDYTHFTLTVAGRLYALSGDARVLRLMNLLINELLPRTDEKWILDATNGARHSLKFPLFSNGLYTVSRLSDRADLAPKLEAQYEKAIAPTFNGNALQNWGNPGLYRGYGCDLATILLADMAARTKRALNAPSTGAGSITPKREGE